MKWLLAIAAVGGVFYAARQLMPSSETVDIAWVRPMIRNGMTEQEVLETVGGPPTHRGREAIGQAQTWFYTDRYDPKDHLIISFAEGRVYKVEVDVK